MAYDFDKIARTYDRLNHLMTLGLDRRWRRRAVHEVESGEWRVENVLDVACGTGDMVLALKKRGCTVTGIDLSEEMLAIARRKSTPQSLCDSSPVSGEQPESASCGSSSSPGTGEVPELRSATLWSQGQRGGFLLADAENLPFAEGEFDAVTCAFGVRNFVHLEQGLSEMLRVLKPGGTMVVLELATPDNPIARVFYNIYTRRVIPWLGSRIAGNREAYTYLPDSIARFPKGEAFLDIIKNTKFKIRNCRQHKLTFGVCRLYTINKEAAD